VHDLGAHYSTLGEWRLPPAGYFFPDMLIYGAASLVTRGLHAALVVAAFLQILLFLISGGFLYRQMGGLRAVNFLWVMLGFLALLFCLASMADSDVLLGAWLGAMATISIHFGAVVGAVAALGFLMAYLREGRARDFVAFVILAGACSISDALFMVWFCAPVIAVLFLSYARARAAVREKAGLAVVALLGGAVLSRLIQARVNVATSPFLKHISLAAIGKAGRVELLSFAHGGMAGHVFYVLLLGLVMGCVVFWIKDFGKNRGGDDGPAVERLAVYMIAACAVAALVAPVMLALFLDYLGTRYLVMALYLPMIGVACLAALWLERQSWWETLPFFKAGLAGVGLLVIGWAHPAYSVPKAISVPALIGCLPDGEAAGLASYWQARPITLFSGRRLQVSALKENGDGYWLIANRHWFLRAFAAPDRMLEFRFIVMDGLQRDSIREKYGAPARRVVCGGIEIWFYEAGNGLAGVLGDSLVRRYGPEE